MAANSFTALFSSKYNGWGTRLVCWVLLFLGIVTLPFGFGLIFFLFLWDASRKQALQFRSIEKCEQHALDRKHEYIGLNNVIAVFDNEKRKALFTLPKEQLLVDFSDIRTRQLSWDTNGYGQKSNIRLKFTLNNVEHPAVSISFAFFAAADALDDLLDAMFTQASNTQEPKKVLQAI